MPSGLLNKKRIVNIFKMSCNFRRSVVVKSVRLQPFFFNRTPLKNKTFATVSKDPKSTTNQTLWSRYLKVLESHPVQTKVVTGTGIAAFGDLSCQLLLEHEDKKIDWKRFAIFTALGGVYVAPVLHLWYGKLGALIPGTSIQSVIKRLAFDQLVFAPAFVPSFFGLLLLLEGKPEEIGTKLREDWWTTVKVNWSVWVPAQFINFSMVPPNLQVLFANVVGLLWNSYLSFVSHKSTPLIEEQQQQQQDAISE